MYSVYCYALPCFISEAVSLSKLCGSYICSWNWTEQNLSGFCMTKQSTNDCIIPALTCQNKNCDLNLKNIWTLLSWGVQVQQFLESSTSTLPYLQATSMHDTNSFTHLFGTCSSLSSGSMASSKKMWALKRWNTILHLCMWDLDNKEIKWKLKDTEIWFCGHRCNIWSRQPGKIKYRIYYVLHTCTHTRMHMHTHRVQSVQTSRKWTLRNVCHEVFLRVCYNGNKTLTMK